MKTAHDAIRAGYVVPDHIWKGYIGDLSDEELLFRPFPGVNHIAWQLGHLIASEHDMIGQCCPGAMPDLPVGFAERHSKETAGSDDPSVFLKKEEYVRLADEQRAGTLKALESLSEEDLNKPSPESLRRMWPTIGDCFLMQGTHWTMHAGQWAVFRRKLGRAPLF
ncbi:MAG: DinB family protein [Planctomycetales bacterium]